MSRNTGSRACAAWRSPKANVTLGRIALLISLACAEEFRGSSSDPSTFKQAKQSSTAYLEGALTSADKAVDGDTGGHLYFSAGCAITEWEANPWWRVDLGSLIPMAVVRIYPRTDNPSFTRTGLQMRVGVKDSWDENPVCASDIALQTVGVTAVNCFAGGRFVFIGAPNTDNARLSICEIDVVIRGPKEVKQYLGAIGRPMDIRVEGVGLLSQDRLRIVKPSVLCGSAAADSMDDALVERTRPYGAPEVESNEVEKWTGVEFLKMGFYKMCWCSGMFSCVSGADFNFLIGFGVITGEMRTIAGNGTDPVRNVDEWEDLYTVRVGAVSGLAISEDGMMLYWSEPHRVREANMVNGSVRTLVGDLIAGNCVEPLLSGHVCGDGLPGTMARLHDPRGLAVCRGELLIADYLNSRIRAYDLTTGIITTKVGSDHGYAGDGGAPHQAKLSGPAGVVCDELRGYWIADTGNSAIRGVRVTPGQSDVITTVVGGLGQGLASPGTWSTQAKLNHPMQLAMSVRWGAPRSLVYVESWNAVARFLPLGSRVMEGAVQQVIGTGSTGHVTSVGGKNIQLNRPEGVAVHSSTAFVADTMNHRIIMVPILEYEPLGCFKEVTVEGESTLVPTLEGDMEAGLSPAEGPCGEEMLDVNDAVARCAHATMRKGWEVFAVRCGGVCASAADADRWYRFNGASTTCEKGRGGLMANSAYRLIKEHAKDLLGNFYVIAGQALTTEALQEAEKPRAGYFGDRLASWLSAMDEPSQLAASATTRNIFFGDRGNNRVRVIFGSLGPQPQTQQFYCTNGLECVLNVEGNGFSEKDHIAFSRDYFTAPVVCGQDRLEEQFPQVHNLAQWSRLFLNKDFNLARISLPVVGQFIVCYCIGNVGKECDVTKEYEFKAGRLHVVGPNARSTVYALAGVPFDLALFGAAFRLTDRIRLIRMNETCGAGGETPVDDMLPFVRVPGNSSLKAGLGPWDEGTETYQVWRDLIIDEATELKVCWCDVAPCPYDSHFKVEAMYLSVGGPTQKTQVVEFGQRFDLLLEGPGGFKAADRVRLQDAQVPCNSPQRRADLEDALPLDATPCEISATSVRWCGVKIPLSAPSSLVACWCGALGGFNATNYTGVPAVWLTVNPGPPLQTDAGPVYRRDLPVPPLSDSGWPSYINKGTYNISARLYARFGWGAGSPGPIQVAICEMPDRCLLPLELREFTSGGLVVAEASRVWDGTTLFPRAVKVSSLSTDLFLAEFVDVELLGQWRRFPLNRWLLMQEHLTDATVWETFTAPPLPTAAPAQSHYTEGDRCGGCGLGTICRERPQTALELAQKGISLATATEVFMTWDCQFACGDGLVVGEEQCDDGNLDALDGCDANCKVEPGFVCDGSHGFAPSQCRAIGCGAAPHPSQHISAACEDPSNLPDAVACRSPAELSACGRLSEPSLFAGCPGASDLRCDLAPVRPKAVLAQFVDQGNFLLVAFDAALAAWNGTDLGEEIPCSEFFTPTTVAELGDRAACIQGSPQHLLVRLGFGASLGEAATAVFVLDTARQYQQINSPVEVSRVFEFPAQRLFLGPALGETSNFVKPTVILRGPTVWGQCGDLHLDGSFSLGSTGRPWKLIRWRCTGDGSSCAKIVGYLPNSCDQQTPLETTGLAVGPVPCGLRATIPEAVASDLTISLATLEIHLKLENAMGLWDEAVHRIRFTVDRVPMAVALSDPAMTVDEGSSVRLELSVGPALPVASLGAGSSCGALGPVSLEWRYSYGSLLDPSQAWPSLTNTPPSLIASLDAKTAALEGTLGDLDVPGSNWTLVARVFHTAENAAPVDVPFFLMVRPQPPSIKLQAPSEISNTCGFSVVAHAGGISGDPYVTWKCLFLDVVSVTEPVSTECAARAMQARGAVLGLPALTPGVYQIDATLDDPSKPSDTIFVRVSATAGPQVRILEPIEPRMLRGDEAQVRFRARLEATACGASAMAAALVVRSSVPGEATQLARPSMVLATKVMNFSQDVQPDDNFEAWIQLSSLPVGLSHTFELLLAESSQARQAMRDYTSSLASFPTWEPPAEVWAYRSAPVTHVMSPAVELFVDPPTGFDSRTLFTLRARALCEGCLYSFRLAPRLANDTSNDCDRATGSWQELRPLSSDPEAILPLLQGTYLLEVQVTPPAGGTARACTTVEVTKSNLDPTFSGLTSAEVEELVQTWTSDASRSIATLRALQRPSLLVESLESIAQEFPKAANLDGDTATKTESALRQLYTEVCEGVQDAVLLLPASEFTDTARRLSSGSTGLRSTMLSLLACMDALFPLLTLTELWQTLQVLNTVLDRNAQLLGLLGPGTSGQPWASYPMLALTDLVLVKAFYVANATSSVVVRSNTTALVDTAMLAALQIGHVAAATGPVSSTTPVEVRNQGRSLVVSSLSLPGQSLATSGLHLAHTTQPIDDLPYPGLTIPVMGTGIYEELTQNVTSSALLPLCLGGASLMGRLDLLIIHWGFNTIGVGERVGSSAPSGGVLVSVRDVRLRSCGVDVPLSPAALDQQEVEMLVELPEEVLDERRWGYGNIEPFRCVRWVSSGVGRPGQWLTEGCTSVYRAKDEEAVGDKAGLEEGVLRCRCKSLIPGTWAVEIVPRPPVIVEPPVVMNVSVRTLVAYGVLILWLPFLVPLLVWAVVGDLILSLYGQEVSKKLAEGLLPSSLLYGGIWGDAEQQLERAPWPLRCDVSLRVVATWLFLRSYCGKASRTRWRDEAKEISRYRDALCYARLKGARVVDSAEVKAIEAAPQRPAQDPTIRERAPVARWRAGPGAAAASPEPKAVKAPVQPPGTTQEQPKLLNHQPDPVGALLKQPDAYEEQQAKQQAALNMTEYDWSEQVRGQVTTTGVQRNALPEGWISQSAGGGQLYYVNLLDGKSSWERPTQPAVKVLSMQELRELLGPASDGVALRRQLEEMLRPRIAERLAAMEDVQAAGQDRRLQAEAHHMAPAPEEEAAEAPETLRQAALVQVEPPPEGDFQHSLSAGDGSLRIPLRFRALSWGFCGLFGACFLRSWPITAALIPCLRPSRLERAAKFAYRLNAALAFAAGACGLQVIAEMASLDEEVSADTRPDGELWAEMEVLHPMAIAVGLLSVLVGGLVAGLLPVFAAVRPKEFENFGVRSAWWRKAWMKQRQTEGFTLFLGLGAGFLAVVLAALKPQPRASLAFSAFFWAVLTELLLLPLTRTLLQTMTIYCAARDCCCGQLTLLARLPGLLQFPHEGSWTSSALLLKHLEALNSEASPRHQVKR